MNGTEQRQHTRVTDTLAKRIEDFSVVMESLAEGLKETAQRGQETRRDLNTLRLRIEAVAADTASRRSVDWLAIQQTTDALTSDFTSVNFRLPRLNSLYGRLRWLLTGR